MTETIGILAQIQAEIRVPKGQWNAHGNYKYRSLEDINDALKPILKKHGATAFYTDEVVEIAGWHYVRSTMYLCHDGKVINEATGYAREQEVRKGMDASQITGACSSYARKYAANGLLLLDDVKDADHGSGRPPAPPPRKPTQPPTTPPVPQLDATNQAFAAKIKRWVGPEKWPKMQKQIIKRLADPEDNCLGYAWEKYGKSWQRKYIHAALGESGISNEIYRQILLEITGVESSELLGSDAYADEIVARIKAQGRKDV